MVVGGDVLLAEQKQLPLIADRSAAFLKPEPVFVAQDARLFQQTKYLHVGHQLPRVYFAEAEFLQLQTGKIGLVCYGMDIVLQTYSERSLIL